MELINEKFCNAFRSKNNLADLSEGDYLDKDILNRLSWLTPKTEDLKVYQCHVIISQARYEKNQKKEKDCWKNNINPVIKESNNTKASIYQYVIDRY